MITFQCNPGLSPDGEMTATCTNAGVWRPDPAGVECKNMTGELQLIYIIIFKNSGLDRILIYNTFST